MKKFVNKTILAGILVILSLVLLLIIIPRNENAYLKAYNKKIQLLDSISSPRIIFVGGSNLCFGLNSRAIRDSLGLPVINYALHAGLGLKFMIDDVEKYVRKGDIVVFGPEYGHFFGSAYGEGITLAPFIFDIDWHKVHLLNDIQLRNVFYGIPDVILERFKGIVTNYVPSEKEKWHYRASGINEFGDEEAHWYAQSIYVGVESSIREANLDENFSEYFISKLDTIHQKAEIIIIPPVICKSAYVSNEKRALTTASFLDKHGYPFITPPSTHVLPDSCTFNTDSHMNKSGVDLFTALVIKELKDTINTSIYACIN